MFSEGVRKETKSDLLPEITAFKIIKTFISEDNTIEDKDQLDGWIYKWMKERWIDKGMHK